jgi:methylthioxylose transferase
VTSAAPRPSRGGELAPGVAVCAIVAAGTVLLVVWGRELNQADPLLPGSGLPWFGRWRTSGIPWSRLAVAAALGGVLVLGWPRWCRSLPWRWLLVASALVTAGWSVTVAAVDGWDEVAAPMGTSFEYLAAVPDVGDDMGRFLQTYVERLPERPIHVQGHPPGQVMVLWAMDRLGLAGPGWAAAQAIGLGAASVPFVLWTVRRLVDEDTARRAAVFCGLAPATLTIATSTDAAFAGVTAATIAAGTATIAARGQRAVAAGAATGLGAGALLYLTYGGVTFLGPLLIPGAALFRRRQLGPLVAAAVGLAVVAAAFTAAGFWWFDGLAATREAYGAGVAAHRPYPYFVVANLAVLAVAVGPATIVGATRLRDRRLVVLLATVALGVVVANLSGLSKAEVERIWLPFMPWLVVAAAPLAVTDRQARAWLTIQLVITLAAQATFRSPW